jgi:hypothetical protein
MKLSGVTDIGIDAAIDEELRELRMIAWRLAAQADLGAGFACASRMTLEIIHLTASSCSSNRPDNRSESRSTPSVSWVRSLEPMEKPSKRWRTPSPG